MVSEGGRESALAAGAGALGQRAGSDAPAPRMPEDGSLLLLSFETNLIEMRPQLFSLPSFGFGPLVPFRYVMLAAQDSLIWLSVCIGGFILCPTPILPAPNI